MMPLGENNSNVIMGAIKGIEKRHSMRTMTYQNNMQKKKKIIEMNLSMRKTGGIIGLISDK
jgi:hypothetical protein